MSRWAERKSRLAELEGFRFFTLMRRVGADGAEDEIPADDPNYVSLTVRARSGVQVVQGVGAWSQDWCSCVRRRSLWTASATSALLARTPSARVAHRDAQGRARREKHQLGGNGAA